MHMVVNDSRQQPAALGIYHLIGLHIGQCIARHHIGNQAVFNQ